MGQPVYLSFTFVLDVRDEVLWPDEWAGKVDVQTSLTATPASLFKSYYLRVI